MRALLLGTALLLVGCASNTVRDQPHFHRYCVSGVVYLHCDMAGGVAVLLDPSGKPVGCK